MAVKTEVQSSVLPALETITRNEVKSAVNGQIAKGLGESMKQTLPNEIERLLLRPDVSNHVARTFSTAVTPILERHQRSHFKDLNTRICARIISDASRYIARNAHRDLESQKGDYHLAKRCATRTRERYTRLGTICQVPARTNQVHGHELST